MTPFYQDNDARLFNGDCRDMSALEDGSIQMVVTSPPYWGLRKYAGVPDLIWGGEVGCAHQFVSAGSSRFKPDRCTGTDGNYDPDIPRGAQGSKAARGEVLEYGGTCSVCGAWRGSFGLEPTPEMYVDHTIEILREVRRVLRPDGVVFWNIGDTYCANRGNTTEKPGYDNKAAAGHATLAIGHKREGDGLKQKDLVLIPARVQLAAQADGWYVRSVIIWDKPNPMPESVRDRPTTSHEYIIMLTKSARYYWDAEAVREAYNPASLSRYEYALQDTCNTYGQHKPGFTEKDKTTKVRPPNPGGRNLRTVWSFPSQPFPDAHFATFPEALPERCILAATPEAGCCEKCGAPWTRVLSDGFTDHDGETESEYEEGSTANRLAKMRQASRANGGEYVNTKETIRWDPTCKCNAGTVPSIVLDPFAGSGTTLWVAKRLGRKSVGYELSPEYCELAVKRLPQQGLL